MTWRSPSALALIVANLVPLYGVLVWDWSTLALLALFWLEILVVWLLSVLRMLICQGQERRPSAGKVVWLPAFGIFYGLFAAALGIVMYSTFGHLEGVLALDGGLLPVQQTVQLLEKRGFGLALAAIVASRVFSFAWNFIGQGEFRRATLRQLIWEANMRALIFFFTLFFGSMFMALGSPAWALAILIGLKTWADLSAHLKAHRLEDGGAPSP